jgi:hypothetical protein
MCGISILRTFSITGAQGEVRAVGIILLSQLFACFSEGAQNPRPVETLTLDSDRRKLMSFTPFAATVSRLW